MVLALAHSSAHLTSWAFFDSDQMPRPVKPLDGQNREAIKQVLVDNGLL